ncbi:BON domain-containing protein [Streptomyces goshikiensis]|uniref:BON domain-containing protein n=1 Tax=Streptomyces goshikiensis TaxID=1942 RepID=UPI0027E5BC8B|nr:BON domain-containing protein [Streptomyces goshikiensis]
MCFPRFLPTEKPMRTPPTLAPAAPGVEGRTGPRPEPMVPTARRHPVPVPPARPAPTSPGRGRPALDRPRSGAGWWGHTRLRHRPRVTQRSWKGIVRLPVVDEEDRLVGIVTRRDLLHLFVRPDSEIRRRVTDEVLTEVLGVPAGDVDVHVVDGSVTLNGRVERRSQLPVLLGLVGQLDGVVAVASHVRARTDDTSRPAPSAAGRRHGRPVGPGGPFGPRVGPLGPYPEHGERRSL